MNMKNTNNDFLEEFKEQNVVLKNRKTLDITGIKKLESLNPNEFIIQTVLGKMIVKGYELEMQVLDIDNGKLAIVGNIKSIEYLDKDKGNSNYKSKEKGFVSKLFK